jgi:EAL domain-containing protein (putative c-di-GMP-specific phosphodiesterase class I)/CheY-like chemotaxis protein
MYGNPMPGQNPTLRMSAPKRPALSEGGSVLLVDDDEKVMSTVARMLEGEGYRVVCATTSAAAVEHVMHTSFDAVISDVNLPGASGIDVLNVVRAYDPDVSLVLLTGAPSAETAIEALRLGVLEYLTKPAHKPQIVAVLERATAARRAAVARREAMPLHALPTAPARGSSVSPRLTTSFERAMGSLFVELEPIADARRRTVIAYEARVGSREAILATQSSLTVAAESLGYLGELRRKTRDLAVKELASAPPLTSLFLDVHASDLLDEDLFSPDSPLARIAERVVLQLRARGRTLSVDDLSARVSVLRFMGFRIAMADLDAGDGRLAQIADLSPDVVKIEADLVRGASRSPNRLRVVTALAAMCRSLGAATVAEGVSTAEERDVVAAAGCDLVQGPLLAPRSPSVRRTPLPPR